MLNNFMYICSIIFWGYFFFEVNTFDRNYFKDRPIAIVFWDCAVIIKFVQWLNILLCLDINYMNNSAICYLNFIQSFIFSFFIGGISARLVELFFLSKLLKNDEAKIKTLKQLNYEQFKKFKSKIIFYLIFNIMTLVFSNFLIIPIIPKYGE